MVKSRGTKGSYKVKDIRSRSRNRTPHEDSRSNSARHARAKPPPGSAALNTQANETFAPAPRKAPTQTDATGDDIPGRVARGYAYEETKLAEVWAEGLPPIAATPAHRFLTRDGTFRSLGRLAPGDELMAADGRRGIRA